VRPRAFAAYFDALTDFRQARRQVGIQHFTWLSLNPKEAEDRALCAAVLPVVERFIDKPNVLGISEIGLNRVTRNGWRPSRPRRPGHSGTTTCRS
jgi:predicted metal-dependent TIM-barrel fold hydrolase